MRLPLLKASSTTASTAQPVKPSISTVVAGPPNGFIAFYAAGSEVYESTSSNGESWTQPAPPVISEASPVVSLSYSPQGDLLLVAYSHGLTLVHLAPYVVASNLTVPASTIYSASIASLNGTYYIAAAVPGKVLLLSSSGGVLDELPINASGVSVYPPYGGELYLAITSGGTIYLSSGSPGSLSSPQPLLAEPAGYSLTQPSLAVYGGGEMAIGYTVESSMAAGTNIGLSYGSLTNINSTVLTTDGTEYSPPSIALVDPGSASIYMAFTSSAGQGNVYFIAQPVATLQASTAVPPTTTTTTAPPPTTTTTTTSTPTTTVPPPPTTTTTPRPSSSSQDLVIAVVVIIIVVIVGALLAIRRRR